jgi:hypothetical protein
MPTTILTGLPRSGTTLLCALLNQQPDAIAMAEPMMPRREWSKAQLFDAIHQFLAGSREKALKEGVFLTKTRSGVVVDNTVGAPSDSSNLRQGDGVRAYVSVDKPLSDDFHLFIKHPTLFTLFAEALSEFYSVYASVRHPLAVLCSWQTVDFAIYHGRQSMVEYYDPSLADRIARLPDRIDRQVETLSWMFDVYERLGHDRILRYEDMTADPEGQLSRIHGQIVPVTHPIKIETIESRYPLVDVKPVARALRRIAPQIRKFYPDFDADLDRYAG